LTSVELLHDNYEFVIYLAGSLIPRPCHPALMCSAIELIETRIW